MPALVTASPAQRCSTASRLPRHRVCQLPRVSRAQQLNSWWRGKLGLTRVYSGAFFFPSRNGIEPRRRRPASATASAGDGPVHQPFKKRPAVGRVPATCRSTAPAVNAVISVSSPRHLYVFFLFLTARPTVTPARVRARGCPGCARGVSSTGGVRRVTAGWSGGLGPSGSGALLCPSWASCSAGQHAWHCGSCPTAVVGELFVMPTLVDDRWSLPPRRRWCSLMYALSRYPSSVDHDR